MPTIRVNDREWTVAAALDTPLLYVLSNELQLQGPRFGCGLAQCGSCSVLVNGVETRSCVTPVSRVVGKSVVTLEGLPRWYARQKGLSKPPELHPVQQAMIDEQAVQCGACYNGMMRGGVTRHAFCCVGRCTIAVRWGDRGKVVRCRASNSGLRTSKAKWKIRRTQ